MGCAAALACLDVYEQDKLVENAAKLGKVLARELGKLKDKHPSIGEVRSIGLFSIVELVKDRKTREPLAPFNAKADQMAVMNKLNGYLQSIREVCDRHGILLIADEVMAGFGRTGKWFAVDNWNVVPDILTVAKGINSGYVPLGAMTVRQHVYDAIEDRFFAGGLTYSGHPLACASGVASIEAFQEEGIVENAAAMGDVFRVELAKLAEKHPSIGEVRGLGCFWGLELVKNRETREPLVPYNAAGEDAKPMGAVMKRALDRGLYLMTHWNVVMCCPPLTITREELDEALDALDDALSVADEFVS
jgi:taurine--2-oxoglutarate transaminase